MATNLSGWLFGSRTVDRELGDTRRAWEETQAFLRATPITKVPLFDIALEILMDALDRAERRPLGRIIEAAGVAIERLIQAEDIGNFEPRWDVIAADVQIAVSFRQMLARRRRWASDYGQVFRAFKRIVADTLATYFNALPEACFEGASDGGGDTFEVPLIDLVGDPAGVVDLLFMLPYADDGFRLDIFSNLRDHCISNMLVASGFLPTDSAQQNWRKLVRAPNLPKKTGAELAALYLGGSPLKTLVDLPVPFRIPDELRFEHCHIVGGTGHGKTQLMQKMIHTDLIAAQEDGRSVIVIDSQGDLINKLVRLDLFSPATENNLAERLVVIDPSDVEFPAALNLFDAHLNRVRAYSPADQERVLNGVIELYELFFGAFLGADLTQKQGVVFKYLARLMLVIPDATIHTLMRVMEDGKPFKTYIDKLDGSARYFFETEFFHPSFTATKKQVLRRLWGVLSTPAFERMFTQPKNKLDLFQAMNEGKIVLVSTAKDLLKREGSQLFGRFFIAMIMQAALERSTLKEYQRQPVFMYVDEAQEYFDDSIETILNQARKYRVGLTLAHQTLDQLSPRLRSAILANTSVKCAGGVSAKDARSLADELRTTPEFIEGMKRRGQRSEFAVWVKHLTGQAIRLSVPLGFLEGQPSLDDEDYENLIAENRVRYCGRLAEVVLPALPAPTPAIAAPSLPPPTPSPEMAAAVEDKPDLEPEPEIDHLMPPTVAVVKPAETNQSPVVVEELLSGKGGRQHRYLQSLVKELAEQCGLKATIEAPLPDGGSVDVAIERDGMIVAVEISVSTSVAWEKQNLKKCIAANFPLIGLVLSKSKVQFARQKAALLDTMPEDAKSRISFLTPEDIPAFISGLIAPEEPEISIVKGYRIRASRKAVSMEEAKAKQETLARIIARSITKQS